MSNNTFLQLMQTCSSGSIEEFNTIFTSLSKEQKTEVTEYDHYACFHVATANGHLEIVNKIINHIVSVSTMFPPDEILADVFEARNGEGFIAALTAKYLDMVELLLSEEYLFSYCIDVIRSNGCFIKTIWDSSLRDCILYIFELNCSDNLTSVQTILENIPKSSHHLLLENVPGTLSITPNFAIQSGNPFESACYGGKVDILQFLWNLVSYSEQKRLIKSSFPYCLELAAKKGYLEIVKQLFEWLDSKNLIFIIKTRDYNAFVYAADGGYLEIVEVIWRALPVSLQPALLAASNYAAYRLAYKNQHVSIIKFLEINSTQETIKIMKKAINQGVFTPKKVID